MVPLPDDSDGLVPCLNSGDPMEQSQNGRPMESKPFDPEIRAALEAADWTAVEHSIQDPFTGQITVRVRI